MAYSPTVINLLSNSESCEHQILYIPKICIPRSYIIVPICQQAISLVYSLTICQIFVGGHPGNYWQSHYLECWDIHGTTHCHIWNWIPLHIRLASWLQNKWTKWKWIQKLYLASLGVKHTIQAHALAEPRCHGWPTLIKLFFTWLMKVYVIDKSSDSLTADLRSPEIILRTQSFNSTWYVYKP